MKTDLEKSEKGDCVVRTVKNAFDIPYVQAHTFCASVMKRKPKKGVSNHICVNTFNDNILFDKKVKQIGEPINDNSKHMGMFTHYEVQKTQQEIRCRMTVGTFMKEYTEGTFILNVRRHMFCIKDGEVLGNSEDGRMKRRILENVFKVTEA